MSDHQRDIIFWYSFIINYLLFHYVLESLILLQIAN